MYLVCFICILNMRIEYHQLASRRAQSWLAQSLGWAQEKRCPLRGSQKMLGAIDWSTLRTKSLRLWVQNKGKGGPGGLQRGLGDRLEHTHTKLKFTHYIKDVLRISAASQTHRLGNHFGTEIDKQWSEKDEHQKTSSAYAKQKNHTPPWVSTNGDSPFVEGCLETDLGEGIVLPLKKKRRRPQGNKRRRPQCKSHRNARIARNASLTSSQMAWRSPQCPHAPRAQLPSWAQFGECSW